MYDTVELQIMRLAHTNCLHAISWAGEKRSMLDMMTMKDSFTVPISTQYACKVGVRAVAESVKLVGKLAEIKTYVDVGRGTSGVSGTAFSGGTSTAGIVGSGMSA